jgi:hypothetical protein
MRVCGLGAVLVAVLLACAAPALAQEAEREPPAPVPVADDDLAAALETGELTEAEYALERARSVFQLGRVRREYGDVARPAPREATLILRDLVARVDDLTGADRATAKRLLARPPAGSDGDLPGNGWSNGAPEAVLCGANVCVHWVDAGGDPDAPPSKDDVLPFGVPDWVQFTLQTWDDIWAEEIGILGYRAPLSDATSAPDDGGSATLDVYLEDLGADGVFGYCTSDDPNADAEDVFAVSAYCVVDNDFSQAQYGPSQTPEEFLQVTSAHEFHHASQFAYDWLEDYWLVEGTASNIEDDVFPLVNDNVTFLRFWSPLNRPATPLDRGGFGDAEYGSWIFWRFLEEKVAGGDPGILREIWERADAATPAAPDDYSLEAVRHELAQRGLAFSDVFARFGVANRLLDYADAQDAGYPAPPRSASYFLGAARPVVQRRAWTLNHLATRYLVFKPGRSVGESGRLALTVWLPNTRARATAIVVKTNGTTVTRPFGLGKSGRAFVRMPFGRGVVKRVELVLSNGSARMTQCFQFPGPPSYSCQGRPRDDHRVFELRTKLLP